MEHKDGPIPGSQFDNRLVQRNPIKDRKARFTTFDYLLRQFAVFGQLLISAVFFAKVHQHLVDRQAVQPCREGAFPAKGSQLAKYLDEDLLQQIFRLRGISSHPQTHGIDSSLMKFEEFLER